MNLAVVSIGRLLLGGLAAVVVSSCSSFATLPQSDSTTLTAADEQTTDSGTLGGVGRSDVVRASAGGLFFTDDPVPAQWDDQQVELYAACVESRGLELSELSSLQQSMVTTNADESQIRGPYAALYDCAVSVQLVAPSAIVSPDELLVSLGIVAPPQVEDDLEISDDEGALDYIRLIQVCSENIDLSTVPLKSNIHAGQFIDLGALSSVDPALKSEIVACMAEEAADDGSGH